jgi:hypothetical protein
MRKHFVKSKVNESRPKVSLAALLLKAANKPVSETKDSNLEGSPFAALSRKANPLLPPPLRQKEKEQADGEETCLNLLDDPTFLNVDKHFDRNNKS